MGEIDVFQNMMRISDEAELFFHSGKDSEQAQKIAKQKEWLRMIRHERPEPRDSYKVAIYIRYYNQTDYEDYLAYHKKQFLDTIALCPNWEFVGFYIDEGQSAPRMESAPEWVRLIEDCTAGKANLIITQKVSNVTKYIYDIALLSRMLAAMQPPIGIYFISEDLFTLASYYQADLQDTEYFPDGWERGLLND